MAQTITLNELNNQKTLEQMYTKAVTEPNVTYHKKGFIKCPECGATILMIPTLRTMNQAIENHVNTHKEQLQTNPILRQHTAIHIRLDLAQQVLQQASMPQLF